jgi:hypothetical protein
MLRLTAEVVYTPYLSLARGDVVADTREAFEVDVTYDDKRVEVKLTRIGGVTPYTGKHVLYGRAYGGVSGHMFPVPARVGSEVAGNLYARRGCVGQPDEECVVPEGQLLSVKEVMACSDPMVAVQRACAQLIENPFLLCVPMVLWVGGRGASKYEGSLDLGEFTPFEVIVGGAVRLIGNFVAVKFGAQAGDGKQRVCGVDVGSTHRRPRALDVEAKYDL